MLLKSFRHGYIVLDVSFSRDGKVIASAGEDKNIKIWSRDGTLLKTFTAPNSSTSHFNSVRNVSFSSDGKIASASTDHTVRIWKLDGTLLQTLKADSFYVWDVSFSPDGQTLASAGNDGAVKLWSDNQTTFQRLSSATGGAASFSPNSQLLAYSTPFNEINVVNVQYPETLSSLQGDSAEISEVSFSGDGQMIASSSWGDTVNLWSLDETSTKILTSQIIQDKDYPPLSNVFSSVKFSPDGQLIAAGNWDGRVRLGTLDGQEIRPFETNQPAVSGISFSPDGQLIAIGTWEPSLSFHGTVVLGKVDNNQITLYKTLIGHGDRVTGINFSPDGKIIASASHDSTIRLWSRDGSPLKTLRGHTNSVISLSFHPDPTIRILASASSDRTVKLWNIDTGSEIATLKGHADKIGNSLHQYVVRFSPDGNLLAATGDNNTIVFWDFNLNNLLELACSWSGDYIRTNSNVSKDDKKLCPRTADR